MASTSYSPTRQSRNWCFTINNFNEDDLESMDILAQAIGSSVQYLVIGSETGEEGTPHLQGFIQFTKPIRFKQVKIKLGRRAHLEATEGTPWQNVMYCKKEGDFQEFGNLIGAGRLDASFYRAILAE